MNLDRPHEIGRAEISQTRLSRPSAIGEGWDRPNDNETNKQTTCVNTYK